MLPVLTARESITEANRHAVGSGMLKEDSRREITRAWSRAAGATGKATVQKATPGGLGAIGISVKRVPAQKAAVDG